MDTRSQLTSTAPIAYFCAEYGIEQQLPLYAGGLGILAGDTIKQAADSNIPFVAVGLLYRGFQSIQQITPEGMQTEADMPFDPLGAGLEHVYQDDQPVFVRVHMTEVDVWLRCWKKTFSDKVTLYLLDAETEQNQLSERSITQLLYSGTQESQVKQQLILGIGGVKLLHTLGIHPFKYHLNEGRPAFLHWQLIRELMDTHGISYESAKKIAREKTVYTNHTLVAAGNQGYSIDLLRVFGRYYSDKMKISIDTLLADGTNQDNTTFAITPFALHASSRANGVSELHSKLSAEAWPEFHWTSITNGVHMPTWQDSEIPKVADNPPALWQRHVQLKQNLSEYLGRTTGYGFNPDHLVIGWARRLADYKQLPLLFSDIGRLTNILKHSQRPVQLLIAGKAHAGDTAAKAKLQEIIHYMQNELCGQALFVPNYSIEVAQQLTRGCDVWLNTPVYGREACGTSGMKAISNGVLNCTVADGWAAEVDWQKTGWILDHTNMPESMYQMIEQQIVPLFYQRDSSGIPHEWLQMMQNSIRLSQRFSAQRMLDEYLEKLYS